MVLTRAHPKTIVLTRTPDSPVNDHVRVRYVFEKLASAHHMNTLERLTVAGITITAFLGVRDEVRARYPIEHHSTTLVERVEHPVSDAALVLELLSGARYHGENGATYCLRSSDRENTRLESNVRFDQLHRCYRTISF
jgi:ribosomal protein S12